jgi:hypothetical protein
MMSIWSGAFSGKPQLSSWKVINFKKLDGIETTQNGAKVYLMEISACLRFPDCAATGEASADVKPFVGADCTYADATALRGLARASRLLNFSPADSFARI